MNTDFPSALQHQLETAVVTGTYTRGQVLPLSDLTSQFRASDEPMRRVLQAVQRKGLLDWVGEAEDSVKILGLPTRRFASVFTHTAQAGLKPRSDVREVEVEPASPVVAEKLALGAGSLVYRYVRTRWVNQEMLANQTNYMPFEVCPGLAHDDVSRYSFQKLLEEKYSAVLVEMKEEYFLVPATKQDREVLDLTEGASVLVIDRIAISATGWPLVWANIRIHPDRYQYVAALWPEAAALLK